MGFILIIYTCIQGKAPSGHIILLIVIPGPGYILGYLSAIPPSLVPYIYDILQYGY